MAKNQVYSAGANLGYVCSDPATPLSGDPVRIGEMCGVALADERADGITSVTHRGVFTLSVKGVDAGGNSAVAVGDRLYYVDADTPKLSKKVAGRFFGFALTAINSGATASINVKLAGS